MTAAPLHDPEVRAALLLISQTLGAQPEPVTGDRYRLLTIEPEGVRRVTLMSRTALLFVAARIRAHDEWIANAHFYDLWAVSTKFRL